ncbi:MAG: peptidylprolyl isomerase [Lentisphaeria bacterium]|nr:peptidylprolyl isomerase [Lentisphaeria bacterium]
MKTQKLLVATTALTIAAVGMFGTVSAADAKAAPKQNAPSANVQPAAKPAAKAPEKPKTLNEVFAFLPDVLATIGDRKITKQDFLKQLGNVPVEYIAQLQPEMIKAQSKQMVNALVEAEIMLALAEKAGIKSSKETVLAEFDKKIKSLPKEQLDMIEKQLKLQNKTLDDVKKELVKDPNTIRFSAIQKYIEDKVRPTVKVSDADIEKYYRENQNQFKTPEMVNASHILISTMPDPNAAKKPTAEELAKKDQAAKEKADKILAQLKQGADFGTLAEKESACDSKKNKGNLGDFQRGQMVPEFEKAAFALSKPGELSPVVKTQFGYHIIKLNSKKAASTAPLAQVKESIRANLVNNGIRKAVEGQIADAKKTMKVTITEIK